MFRPAVPILLAAASFAAPCGCTSLVNYAPSSPAAAQPAPRPARISHIVFGKLRDPADRDALIADCDRLLAGIPGVVCYAAGPHHDTGRATVIADYDVGMYIGFDTDEDYAVYVSHPDHVELVERWLLRLEWLRVYDFVDDSE